jgi:hypothetical protein
MSDAQAQDGGGGCLALSAVLLAIGAAVAALLSIAALIDPFSWMPSVGELWEDCPAEYDDPDQCDWSVRFPGLWGHAFVNLLYVTAAAAALVWVAAAVSHLREARPQRFSDDAQAERYDSALHELSVASACTALIAAVPVIAALA